MRPPLTADDQADCCFADVITRREDSTGYPSRAVRANGTNISVCQLRGGVALPAPRVSVCSAPVAALFYGVKRIAKRAPEVQVIRTHATTARDASVKHERPQRDRANVERVAHTTRYEGGSVPSVALDPTIAVVLADVSRPKPASVRRCSLINFFPESTSKRLARRNARSHAASIRVKVWPRG